MHNIYVKHIKGLILVMKNISEIFIKYDIFPSFHIFFMSEQYPYYFKLIPKNIFKKTNSNAHSSFTRCINSLAVRPKSILKILDCTNIHKPRWLSIREQIKIMSLWKNVFYVGSGNF